MSLRLFPCHPLTWGTSVLGRRESSHRMWKLRQVMAGTRTCRGRCGQGMATLLRSPATSPLRPQGSTCGGTSPVSKARCRSWVQGSKSCQGVRSWALQAQSGISRARGDVGQEAGHWGTRTWGADGAGDTEGQGQDTRTWDATAQGHGEHMGQERVPGTHRAVGQDATGEVTGEACGGG